MVTVMYAFWDHLVFLWWQIRCFGNQVLTHTFKAADTLVDVNKFIMLNRSGDNTEAYKLMTNFPKKVFTPEDMNKTLAELGRCASVLLQACEYVFAVCVMLCRALNIMLCLARAYRSGPVSCFDHA